MKLRDYQTNAINEIRYQFSAGNNRVVLCSPTGSGKTIVFSEISRLALKKGNSVLICTDRKELLAQTENKLNAFDIVPSFVNADTKKLPGNAVCVGMIETIKRRLKRDDYKEFVSSFDLIVIDECHKNTFNRLFESLQDNQYVIGASATPYRTGNMKPLKSFYDIIVDVIQISELIHLKFLSRPKYYGIPIDLKGIRITAGDYNESDMGELYSKKEIYTGVVKNYNLHIPGSKALVFSPTIKTSINLFNDLVESGISAKHLDSTMSKKERESILNGFANKEFNILCNVGILTTGYDDPTIETIILFRATKSLPLYLQMIGRGSRISENKKDFTVLDFGNNIKEHSFWDEDRTWTLENQRVKTRKESKEMANHKECPKCGCLIPISSMKCMHCKYEYPKPKKDEIEVLLQEMKPEQIQEYSNSCTVYELEEIRHFKDYKIGWLLRKLASLEEFKTYAKYMGYKQGWAYINAKRYNVI